ncbi:MAG: carboxypeptidase-like regulatory domain-containing protein, partial [Anaerolineae bacterium]
MSRRLKILVTALTLGLLSVRCSPKPTPTPLPPAANAIRGLVLDAQGTVAGATVRVRATDNKTLTAGDGSFILTGLDAGVPVSVTAWSEGYFVGWTSAAPSPEPVTITIKPHYTTDNPDYDWFSVESAEGSQSCARCMPSYSEWQADAHSQSATNPIFQTLLNGSDVDGNPNTGFGLLTDRGRADFVDPNSNCAPCHVPVATDLSAVSGIAAEGVFCEFCHKVGDVTLDPATGLPYPDMPGVLSMRLYRPEGEQQLFFGNFDDVTRRVSYLPLEQESAFCAPCHFGAFWDTVAYNSFGEWLESPYSDPETGQTCQDCHMPPAGYDYFVFPEQGGLHRDPNRILSHLMPGARDEEFLQSTVTMAVTATQGTDGLLVEVAITNSGAGHHVPTDSPLRHLILLVQAHDGQGHPLDYVGRQVVPDWGGVGDLAQGNYAGQPGKGFAKIQQDADGNAPAPQWRSTEIIYDSRIPAL